jgi:hypothetical protein
MLTVSPLDTVSNVDGVIANYLRVLDKCWRVHRNRHEERLAPNPAPGPDLVVAYYFCPGYKNSRPA